MIELLALLVVACGLAGAAALSRSNQAGTGCLLGLLLGPIGLGVALMMRERRYRDCPHCAERIQARAQVCRHCGRDVEPA